MTYLTEGKEYKVLRRRDDGRPMIRDDQGDMITAECHGAFERVEDDASTDAVFRPHHYSRFVIEPLTFVNANKLPYNIGNVVKYVCRYDAKNGLDDLKKARRYIDIQIECLEREERIAAGEDPATVWSAML